MAEIGRTSFKSSTQTTYPDNTTGEISPADIRTQMDNIADSTVFKGTGKSRAPSNDDDSVGTGGEGTYNVGDIWVDTTSNNVYTCLDDTAFNAVWYVYADQTFVDSRYHINGYATRDELVTARPSLTLVDGMIIAAAGILYKVVLGDTSISDLHDLVPFGTVTPYHWTENVDPGTTDMSIALQLAVNYETAVGMGFKSYIDLLGQDILVSNQTFFNNRQNLTIANGKIIANSVDIWPTVSGQPAPIFDCSGDETKYINFTQLYIECSFVASGIRFKESSQCSVFDIEIHGMGDNGYGIKTATSADNLKLTNVTVQQYDVDEAGFDDQTYRTAYGFEIRTANIVMSGCTAGYCLYPFYKTSGGSWQLNNCHFFNGDLTTVTDADAIYTAYINSPDDGLIVGNYFEGGTCFVNVNTLDNGSTDTLLFSGNRFNKAGSDVNYAIQFDTSVANNDVRGLILNDVHFGGYVTDVAWTTSDSGSFSSPKLYKLGYVAESGSGDPEGIHPTPNSNTQLRPVQFGAYDAGDTTEIEDFITYFEAERIVNVYVAPTASGDEDGTSASDPTTIDAGMRFIQASMVGTRNTEYRLVLAAGTYTDITQQLFISGTEQKWFFNNNLLVIQGPYLSGLTPTAIIDGTTLNDTWLKQTHHLGLPFYIYIKNVKFVNFDSERPMSLWYGGGAIMLENVHCDGAAGLIDARHCIVRCNGSDAANPALIENHTNTAIVVQQGYYRIGDNADVGNDYVIEFNGTGTAIQISRNSMGYVRSCVLTNGANLIQLEKSSRVRTQNNTGTAWTNAFITKDNESVWDDDYSNYPDVFTGAAAGTPVLKIHGQTMPFESTVGDEVGHKHFRGPQITLRPDTLAAIDNLSEGVNYEISSITDVDWAALGGPASAVVGDTFTCTASGTAPGLAYTLDLDISEYSTGGSEYAGIARLPMWFWFSDTAMVRFKYTIEIIADDDIGFEVKCGTQSLGSIDLPAFYPSSGSFERWTIDGTIFGTVEGQSSGYYTFVASPNHGSPIAHGHDTDSFNNASLRSASGDTNDWASIVKFGNAADEIRVTMMTSWVTP